MSELTPEQQQLLSEGRDFAILTPEEQVEKLAQINKDTFTERLTPSQPMSFLVPMLILNREGDDLTIRRGFTANVQFRVVESYTFEEPSKDYPFRIIKTSPSPFQADNKMVRALDENSKPTAAEWAEHTGKEVLWQYDSYPLVDKPPQLTYKFGRVVYHNRWSLPDDSREAMNILPQDMDAYSEANQKTIQSFINEDVAKREEVMRDIRGATEVPPVLLGMVGQSSGLSQAPTIGPF